MSSQLIQEYSKTLGINLNDNKKFLFELIDKRDTIANDENKTKAYKGLIVPFERSSNTAITQIIISVLDSYRINKQTELYNPVNNLIINIRI